jgi:Spy/CpxP family protein refolding chaperone
MISVNKLVAVTALLVTISFQVEAQGGGRGGGGQRGGGERMQQMQQRARDQMFKDITLDEAQTKQIDSITAATMTRQREMMRAARSGGGDMEDVRTQAQTMQADERKAIRDVLRPEQQTQFDKNIEAMPAPGARQRPPREQ